MVRRLERLTKMIFVNFVLFLSSLDQVCFTTICKVKLLYLSIASSGQERDYGGVYTGYASAFVLEAVLFIEPLKNSSSNMFFTLVRSGQHY